MIASPTGVPTRNWLSLRWLPPTGEPDEPREDHRPAQLVLGATDDQQGSARRSVRGQPLPPLRHGPHLRSRYGRWERGSGEAVAPEWACRPPRPPPPPPRG